MEIASRTICPFGRMKSRGEFLVRQSRHVQSLRNYRHTGEFLSRFQINERRLDTPKELSCWSAVNHPQGVTFIDARP